MKTDDTTLKRVIRPILTCTTGTLLGMIKTWETAENTWNKGTKKYV